MNNYQTCIPANCNYWPVPRRMSGAVLLLPQYAVTLPLGNREFSVFKNSRGLQT